MTSSSPKERPAVGGGVPHESSPEYADNAVARKLDNAMTVTMERLPYLRSASIGLWIKTGSGNEPKSRAGISHVLEHLFFKGTKTRTARQLMEAIESKGGHINAFTSREYTCVYIRTLDSHVTSAIEILADVIKNSTFADLDKERNVILEEIASVEDVPEDYVHDRLLERMWPNHPLGRAVTGYANTVSAMTVDHIRDYYEKWYRPRNMYFSIAGNFDEDAVLDQVSLEFGGLRPRGTAKRYEAPSFRGEVGVEERGIAQSHFCLGFPGPKIGDPRRYVYEVMGNALGGASTSRLFDRVRELEGLAYSIYSFHACYMKAGMVGVYAAVAPENLARTFDLTSEEIRKFRDEPMSEKELLANREHLKGSLLMSLENTFNRMARMAKSMMYYNRLVSVREIIEAVESVTVEDVQKLAQDTFRPEQCAMVLLGPPTQDAERRIAL